MFSYFLSERNFFRPRHILEKYSRVSTYVMLILKFCTSTISSVTRTRGGVLFIYIIVSCSFSSNESRYTIFLEIVYVLPEHILSRNRENSHVCHNRTLKHRETVMLLHEKSVPCVWFSFFFLLLLCVFFLIFGYGRLC